MNREIICACCGRTVSVLHRRKYCGKECAAFMRQKNAQEYNKTYRNIPSNKFKMKEYQKKYQPEYRRMCK